MDLGALGLSFEGSMELCGPPLGGSGAPSGGAWDLLGCPGGSLGAFLGHLGPILGPSWAILGPSWVPKALKMDISFVIVFGRLK